MPRLLSGFLRIEFGEKQARELFEAGFKEKGWGTPLVKSFSLVFSPRYRFEYCIVGEEGEGRERRVSDFSVSKGIFDPMEKELAGGELKEADLASEFAGEAEFKVLNSGLGRKEAKKIAMFLLSKREKVPKESIEFLSFSLYHAPHWNFRLECENNNFEVEINASTGEYREVTPLPVKHQPWANAVQETFSDLKSPKTWFHYFGETASVFFKTFKALITNRFVKGFFSLLRGSKAVQLAVLVIILAILLCMAFGWPPVL